jgi:hypothetical protein
VVSRCCGEIARIAWRQGCSHPIRNERMGWFALASKQDLTKMLSDKKNPFKIVASLSMNE